MQQDQELNREYLESYLSHLWKTTDVRVTDVVKFPRGMSRETWFIECELPAKDTATLEGHQPDIGFSSQSSNGKHRKKLILRRDLPTLSIVPTALRYEFDIYARLQNSSVPVAPVLVYETDPKWLSDPRPFYLREQIEGTWDVPHYLDPSPAFDTLRIEAAKEHVRKLALIHTCDWQGLGFGDIMPAPSATSECAHLAIERNFEVLQSLQIEPMPIMTEAREWLHDHAPVAPCISLLKGTNGRGEEVFRDGEIVAMSDWEQASIGDPASDFARTQDFLNDIVRDGQVLWGLKPALAYYKDITGIQISEDAVEYYRVLNCFENIVALHHAALPLADGSDRLARLAWLSTEVMHYANRTLLAATANRKMDVASVFSTQRSTVNQ